MNKDQTTVAETVTPPYTPSDAAKQAFTLAVEHLAMATYRELPDTMKPAYARGFAMGFDGLPFPREAVENRAMDDGYMFGTRVDVSKYMPRKTAPVAHV